MTVFRAGRTKYSHPHHTAAWEGLDSDTDPPSFSAHPGTTRPSALLDCSSTPLHLLSGTADTSQSLDPGTLSKISVMEEELAALRKQIAQIIMTQETKSQGQCPL